MTLIVTGVALHAFAAVFLSNGGPGPSSIALLIFSSIPYGCCYLALKVWGNAWASGTGAALILAVDLLIYYSVLIATSSSTNAVALAFMPFWNILIVAPAGMFIGWLISRARRSSNDAL